MIGYKFSRFLNIPGKVSQLMWTPLLPNIDNNLIDKNSVKKLLMENKIFIFRCDTDFDCPYETNWWYIIKRDFTEIMRLPKGTRYLIRKAEKKFKVRRVSRDEIINKGYLVYKNAYIRYQTHETELDKSEFYTAIDSLPEATDFWAIFSIQDDQLVGFSENYVEDEFCFFNSIWLDPAFMKDGCGYLLMYEMESYYLGESRVKLLCNGTRNVSHATNIHQFLLSKFSYTKAFCLIYVQYRFPLNIVIPTLYTIYNIAFGIPDKPKNVIESVIFLESIRRKPIN